MSGPSVAEYVEYCQTQAGLLAGRIETFQAEAARLLDEIDTETATVRGQLASDETADTDPEAAVAAIEGKQERVREIQTSIATCTDVASGYTNLGERVADSDDASAALAEIVQFELEQEAYNCFEDRTTLAEQVAGRGEGDG